MKIPQNWLVYALGSAAFAALTTIFGKIGVEKISSNLGTLIRTVVALIIGAAIVAATGEAKGVGTLSRRTLLYLVLSGAGTGLSWLCYYHALQIAPASKVGPIDKLSVVFVIVLSLIFLHEKLTWQLGVGGVLITAGAVVIATAA